MKDANSPDLASVVKAIQGGDGRKNQERHLKKAIKELMANKKITVPHALLLLPPVLFEADMSTSTPTKTVLPIDKDTNWCDGRLWTVSGVPYNIDGSVGVDLAAGMQMAGIHYSADSKSSPFNATRHSDQARICEVFVLPFKRSIEAECKARWPRCWRTMTYITLWMNDHEGDWTDLTRRPAAGRLRLRLLFARYGRRRTWSPRIEQAAHHPHALHRCVRP